MIDAEIVEREHRRLCDLIENDGTGNHAEIVRAWYADVSRRESPAVANSAYRLKKMIEKVGRVDEKATETRLFWVGVAFAAATLFFLMFAALQRGLDDHQMRIIRVIASICGGASAAFLSGVAMMRADIKSGPVKIVLCGTAGVAIFFTVFLLFNRL